MSTRPPNNDSNTTSADRPVLTAPQEQALLRRACEVMAAVAHGRAIQLSDPSLAGAADQSVWGCFVTARCRGQLRGCCGFFGQTADLSAAVRHAATRTVGDDKRFSPIAPTELIDLDVEVWLLFAPKPIEAEGEDRITAVEVGRHGLQISCGGVSGLLLPSVATKNGLNAKEFLQQVSLKAGLPPSTWKQQDAQIVTFEGISVAGKFDSSTLIESGGETS